MAKWNCNGLDDVGTTLSMAWTHDTDILCPQEVRMTSNQRKSVAKVARRHRFNYAAGGEVAWSRDGNPKGGVVTLSRLKMIQIKDACFDDYRAVATQVFDERGRSSLLVNVHEDASWRDVEQITFYDAMFAVAARKGGTRRVIADHNTEVTETPIQRLVLAGVAEVAEDPVATRLPTRQRFLVPDGRHIDYMLDSAMEQMPERRTVSLPMYTDESTEVRNADTADAIGYDDLEGGFARWNKTGMWSDHIMIAYAYGGREQMD